MVSNSYGGSEYPGETQDSATYYNHAGVAITASSGDAGYGVQFPAASPGVASVGGTSLRQNTNTGTRNAVETAWSGAGSGCSAYEPKPAWQTDRGCSKRTVADVSAVADPSTGVWVYDSYGDPGFEVFGGTSVAAPIVGAVYAMAANPASSAQVGSYPYGHPGALNDVVSGSNGSCGSYLCTAGVGYDGPTGLGTPNATLAFTPPTPGFSLSASPSTLTITPGATATSTLTLSPQTGFSGTVSLSAAVSPGTGLTTQLSSPAVPVGPQPGTSTLSLSAKTSGQYSVTVTATAGGVSHTATLTVSVTSPNFSLRVTPTRNSAVRGHKATFTVVVTPSGGFTGSVTLSLSGQTPHDGVVFTPNPVLNGSGTATLTLTTSALDTSAIRYLQIVATSGSLYHTATVVMFYF